MLKPLQRLTAIRMTIIFHGVRAPSGGYFWLSFALSSGQRIARETVCNRSSPLIVLWRAFPLMLGYIYLLTVFQTLGMPARSSIFHSVRLFQILKLL